jgi:hypothetical protein
MTNEPLISIFDGYGKIRDLSGDADVAAIEGLPDEPHRKALFEVIAASNARDAGSDRVVAARKAVRIKEIAFADASAAYSGVVPLRDTVTGNADNSPRAGATLNPAIKNAEHVAALRAVSAAQRPGYVPAKPTKNKLKAAMDKAEAELADARAEIYRATSELRRLETKAGEAINAWRACLPVMDRNTLMKSHIAAGQAERAARVARGEHPDAPKVVPQYSSELDRIKGAGKIKPPRPLMSGRR